MRDVAFKTPDHIDFMRHLFRPVDIGLYINKLRGIFGGECGIILI